MNSSLDDLLDKTIAELVALAKKNPAVYGGMESLITLIKSFEQDATLQEAAAAILLPIRQIFTILPKLVECKKAAEAAPPETNSSTIIDNITKLQSILKFEDASITLQAFLRNLQQYCAALSSTLYDYPLSSDDSPYQQLSDDLETIVASTGRAQAAINTAEFKHYRVTLDDVSHKIKEYEAKITTIANALDSTAQAIKICLGILAFLAKFFA